MISLRPCMPALALIGLTTILSAHAGEGDWLRWGGPNGDFSTSDVGLARQWPEDGPRTLWSRPLGAGHSAIVVEDGRLYTMFRRGEQDVVTAIRAADGETLWESAYDAPPKPDMMLDFGPGPHSTPLIERERLFTISATAILNAWDKASGKPLWKHDLMAEMGASHLGRGYGASPVAYGDTVLINVGGPEVGVVAFRQDNGEVVWKSEPFKPGHATPLLARINNEDHLILATGANRVGIDPANGALRWRHQVDPQQASIMSTPLFVPPDNVIFSSAYGGGSLSLRIVAEEKGYKVEELWHTRRMMVQHQSLVRVGDLVCGSTGDFGPAFLTALNIKEGTTPEWKRVRGFAKANMVKAGDLLIILDETGDLALANASSEAMNILSRVKLLEEKAWTVPTLVGARLYLRDNKNLRALDLGAANS